MQVATKANLALPFGVYPGLSNTATAAGFYIDGCPTVLRYVLLDQNNAQTQIALQLQSPQAATEEVKILFATLHQALPAAFQLLTDANTLSIEVTVAAEKSHGNLVSLMETTLPLLRSLLGVPAPQNWPPLDTTSYFPPHLLQQEAELLQKLQTASPEALLGADNPHWQQKHTKWWNLRELQVLSSRERVDFSAIYQAGGWGNPYNDGTVSGDGSAMVNTRVVRSVLDKLVPLLDISSLLDIPCGDFHWMRTVRLDNVRYVGADCVTELIAANQVKYGSASREFKTVDLRGDPLDRFDLVLVRDLFIHLSFDEIFAALANIKLSRSRYLAASTYFHVTNRETPVDFHPINLMRPPFNFPPPLFTFFEQIPNAPTRSIGVWELDALPTFYDRISA